MKKFKVLHSSKKNIHEGSGFNLFKVSGVVDQSITTKQREKAQEKGETLVNFADIVISVGDKTPDFIREQIENQFNSIKEGSMIFVGTQPTIKTREYNNSTYVDVVYNIFDSSQFAVDNSEIPNNDGFDDLSDDDLPF